MLVLALAAGYYAVVFGAQYVDYLRLRDAMGSEAQFARTIGDDAIRQRLEQKASELGLPPAARRFRIRRRAEPREIVISTSWQAEIKFPFFVYTVTFQPEVRAQL